MTYSLLILDSKQDEIIFKLLYFVKIFSVIHVITVNYQSWIDVQINLK